MSEDRLALVCEVAAIRARDVDRWVMQLINVARGDVTTEQVEEWERKAYQRWRETWPALNGLLIPHATSDSREEHAHG